MRAPDPNTAIRFLTIWVSASLLVLSPRVAWSQPDEVRIRALSISSERDSVEAIDLLGGAGMVIRGSLPEQFSQLSGPVGDVNGDGLADLALFWGTTGRIDFAELYLVFGRSDLPEHLNIDNIDQFATRIHREPALPRWTGRPFLGSPHTVLAGDLDGDGVGDFFIGQKGPVQEYSDLWEDLWEVDPETYYPGSIYLVYGTVGFPAELDLLNPPAGFRVARFSSTKPNRTDLGDDISAGGDLNGDGRCDSVFGAANAQMEGVTSEHGPGRVYVLFGQEEPYAGLIDVEEIGARRPGVILHGDASGQGFGYETSFVGDVNGDRIDDLLIGVTASETSSTVENHVLLLYGSPNLPTRVRANEVVEAGQGVRFHRLPGGKTYPRADARGPRGRQQ